MENGMIRDLKIVLIAVTLLMSGMGPTLAAGAGGIGGAAAGIAGASGAGANGRSGAAPSGAATSRPKPGNTSPGAVTPGLTTERGARPCGTGPIASSNQRRASSTANGERRLSDEDLRLLQEIKGANDRLEEDSTGKKKGSDRNSAATSRNLAELENPRFNQPSQVTEQSKGTGPAAETRSGGTQQNTASAQRGPC
jgi:hypothetical protein